MVEVCSSTRTTVQWVGTISKGNQMFASSTKNRGKKYASLPSKRTKNSIFCDKIKVAGLALIKVKTIKQYEPFNIASPIVSCNQHYAH